MVDTAQNTLINNKTADKYIGYFIGSKMAISEVARITEGSSHTISTLIKEIPDRYKRVIPYPFITNKKPTIISLDYILDDIVNNYGLNLSPKEKAAFFKVFKNADIARYVLKDRRTLRSIFYGIEQTTEWLYFHAKGWYKENITEKSPLYDNKVGFLSKYNLTHREIIAWEDAIIGLSKKNKRGYIAIYDKFMKSGLTHTFTKAYYKNRIALYE